MLHSYSGMDRTPFQSFCSQGQNEQNVVNENPRWRTARWALRIQTRLYRSTGEKVRQASLSAFQMYFGTGESSLWRQVVDMLEQYRLHSPWFEACVSSPLYTISLLYIISLFSFSFLFTRKIAVITAAMTASSSATIFVTQCLLVTAHLDGRFFMETIPIIPIIPNQAFRFQNCFRLRLRFLCAGFFFACFQGKNSCYDRNNAVNGWHTWRSRVLNDFWWVGSTKLIFVNVVIVETTFPQSFVVDEWPTTSFPPSLYVTDYSECGLFPSK